MARLQAVAAVTAEHSSRYLLMRDLILGMVASVCPTASPFGVWRESNITEKRSGPVRLISLSVSMQPDPTRATPTKPMLAYFALGRAPTLRSSC